MEVPHVRRCVLLLWSGRRNARRGSSQWHFNWASGHWAAAAAKRLLLPPVAVSRPNVNVCDVCPLRSSRWVAIQLRLLLRRVRVHQMQLELQSAVSYNHLTITRVHFSCTVLFSCLIASDRSQIFPISSTIALLFLLYEYCSSPTASNNALMPRQQWPCERIVRPHEQSPEIRGMAVGRSAEELLLADAANRVVRAFDLRRGSTRCARHLPVSSARRAFRECALHELWSPEHPLDEFGVQRAHRHTCRLHRLHRRFRDAQHHSIVRAHKHLRVTREPPARPAAGLLCRTAFSERRASGYRRLPEPYVECAGAGGSPDFQLASTWDGSCHRSPAALLRVRRDARWRRAAAGVQLRPAAPTRKSSGTLPRRRRWSNGTLAVSSTTAPLATVLETAVCSCAIAVRSWWENGRFRSSILAPEAGASSREELSSGAATTNTTSARISSWFPSVASRTTFWLCGTPNRTPFRYTRCCSWITSL